MPLRSLPPGTNRYGRPWFPLDQTRGLAEHQCTDLVRAAKASGYLDRVGEAIIDRVGTIARDLAGDRRLDIVELGGGDGVLFDRVRSVTRSYINIEPGDIELSPIALRRLADPLYGSVRCSTRISTSPTAPPISSSRWRRSITSPTPRSHSRKRHAACGREGM